MGTGFTSQSANNLASGRQPMWSPDGNPWSSTTIFMKTERPGKAHPPTKWTKIGMHYTRVSFILSWIKQPEQESDMVSSTL